MIKKLSKQYAPENATIEFFDNAAVFEVPASEIKKVLNDLHGNKDFSLKLITATDEREAHGCFKIWYIFGVPKENLFLIPFIQLKNTEEFPSITPSIHAAINYERRIQTFFGLTPVGHPDPRRLILHENWPNGVFPLRKDFDWNKRPAEAKPGAESHETYKFQKVEGEGIYEIPVGPIHAGIIEPGHFRFSVAGEEIVLLEPKLGYTHKGSEKLFEMLPLADKVRLSEKISGDSSFSHSLAFCQALEQLSATAVPKRARYLRVIFAELERLANHFGDIGAMMLDTGFNFGGAHGARLREMIMQLHERLTGSRFLRGVNVIGGVTKDISGNEKEKLSDDLERIMKDFFEIMAVAENSVSLLNRLKATGALSREIADDLGMMGVAGKAVGIAKDTRVDYPYAAYDELRPEKVVTEQTGDVCARFRVRVQEAFASIEILQQALRKMPEGAICGTGEHGLHAEPGKSGSGAPAEKISFKKNAIAVGVVEGWRGEIVYFVTTDAHGNISRVVPRDPSFVNWAGVGEAGLGNVVPDFPLINKSFNMSYSGNDL